jgi:cytochrome c oxidase cbb3-type subunit 4
MDINDIRSAVTLLGFVSFVALVRWVYMAARRQEYDAAAQLPFEGEIEEGRS